MAVVVDQPVPLSTGFVPESRFGVWFLSTNIWVDYVLKCAADDLNRLIGNRRASYPVIVDFGCGFGRSFKLLEERFRPIRIVGIDADPKMLARSRLEARRHGLPVELKRTRNSSLPLGDESVDMIFCHQTFHHLVDQRRALREFHRVLKPEGLLLFAESTRKFIDSWIIRLLFRHPMETQRSAHEYLSMINEAGFETGPDSVSYPYSWWSRKDFAIMERWFGVVARQPHEETLINVIAVRR